MKHKLGRENVLYPTPTVLVGATVNDKPNFITIAHIGIMPHTHISLGINKAHYANQGIREHQTFRLNIPSENLVNETDYVALVTGDKVDVSKIRPLLFEMPLKKYWSLGSVSEADANCGSFR